MIGVATSLVLRYRLDRAGAGMPSDQLPSFEMSPCASLEAMGSTGHGGGVTPHVTALGRMDSGVHKEVADEIT